MHAPENHQCLFGQQKRRSSVDSQSSTDEGTIRSHPDRASDPIQSRNSAADVEVIGIFLCFDVFLERHPYSYGILPALTAQQNHPYVCVCHIWSVDLGIFGRSSWFLQPLDVACHAWAAATAPRIRHPVHFRNATRSATAVDANSVWDGAPHPKVAHRFLVGIFTDTHWRGFLVSSHIRHVSSLQTALDSPFRPSNVLCWLYCLFMFVWGPCLGAMWWTHREASWGQWDAQLTAAPSFDPRPPRPGPFLSTLAVVLHGLTMNTSNTRIDNQRFGSVFVCSFCVVFFLNPTFKICL